ncbi:hypothetical protein K1Y72_20700 [Actinomadura sp. PM05-2]|uniref:Uncharacterized protein n=2 Tax=Actinomadura parmotrematis TaxID=2864039 RepID=A0ABS7FWL3_9ACTN|nr:hypothetical protein [Actinomadura parmotrematis]
MPCYRCGVRQTDPARGASPWRRGVLADRHVLVCPLCQTAHDWAAGLDRCAACGSPALQCRLGEIECRDCGHTRAAVPRELADEVASATEPGLAEEVEAALARVLRRRSNA